MGFSHKRLCAVYFARVIYSQLDIFHHCQKQVDVSHQLSFWFYDMYRGVIHGHHVWVTNLIASIL